MKKISSLLKLYQKQLKFLSNIILLFLCLRLFYLFLKAIWLASTTNAFASLKEFSLKNIGEGLFITSVLIFFLILLNGAINLFLKHPNQLFLTNGITFSAMVFLLISFSMKQFNIITGILATFILIQNNFTTNLTSKVLGETDTKSKKYILKRTKRKNDHHYNRKFPKRTYRGSRRFRHN